jgi:hypothetical protein
LNFWPCSVKAVEVAYCSLLYSLWNLRDGRRQLLGRRVLDNRVNRILNPNPMGPFIGRGMHALLTIEADRTRLRLLPLRTEE